MWGIELVVMALMIGVNSIFAGYEIALASIKEGRLQGLAAENRPGAKVALYMKQNMEASLAVVQLGITLVGVIAATVGGAGAEESLGPTLKTTFGLTDQVADLLAIALVVIPLTVVTIIAGELIPKVFSLRNAEWVCLKLSPFMRWFSFSVWPAVWMFETVVTGVMSWGERRMGAESSAKPETAELQDLRAAATLARTMRIIGHREERIIRGATEIPARPIKSIMLPAGDINTLHASSSLSDNLIAAHLNMHTRFPVVERKGDIQSVIGYVNVKDIIAIMQLNPQESALRSIIRAIPSLNEDLPIADALERLIREHTHIALVRGLGERVVGMISMEDIMEELVGDIEDEYDRLPAHLTPAGTSWVVGGGISLEKLKAQTGIDLVADSMTGEVKSLNDWVEQQLRRPVQGGDILNQPSVRVVVRKIRRNKLLEAQLTPVANRMKESS